MTYRKTYIEFIRCIACFLVIVNHTQGRIFIQRVPSKTWFVSISCFFISKIAVPLFLMIMGILLLEKSDTVKKSTERILRILVILTAASLLYAQSWKTGNSFQVIHFLKQLPQSPVITTFWYLYLYLALLCLLPLLQRFAAALDKGSLFWLLFLSMGIMGTAPLLHILVPNISICPYFTNVLFSPYLGVVFCGYYIHRYMRMDKRKFFLSCIIFISLLLFQVTITYSLYCRNPKNYLFLDNAAFFTITASAASFLFAVKYLFAHIYCHPKLETMICFVGSHTFGAYLLIDLILNLSDRMYYFLCGYMHELFAMFVWEMFIFIASISAAALLKRLPILQNWI